MEKHSLLKSGKAFVHFCILLTISLFPHSAAVAQSCPASSNPTLNAYPNTYYPATANANAGTSTITLGNAIGATPIAASDILLVIQMQGAQINFSNLNTYGDGGGSGTGYLNNANLVAGKMEYVVAANAVALTGGTRTLTLHSPLVNSYKNAGYVINTDGQYTFQVIRVPVYYNVTLGATIKPPAWNGATGGVVVLYATQTLNMNGHTIDASGAGFRGGGGMLYSKVGSGSFTDYVGMSTALANGAKGEGIAGTPRYINNNWASPAFDNGAEGYPFGSMDMGAPGNAGGGATDGNPSKNNNNAGGGGGGNGAAGGIGGDGWNTPGEVTGGKPGAKFSQVSPSRLVMGGGGGAGSTDGGTGTFGTGNGLSSSGMPGGGIVLVTAGMVSGTGTIDVSGVYTNTFLANDGSGGGGAGGSVVITVASGSGLSGVTVHADGSAGSSNTGAGSPHGPGGGGGGGVIYSNQPLNAASTAAGGVNGTTFGGINYAAMPGAVGIKSQAILLSQTPTFPMSCTVLATEFVSVSAIDQNGNSIVSWQVANEENVDEYVVERSFDGSNFTRAGVIPYKPVPVSVQDYSYTDPGTSNNHPLCYYRIKRIDADGQSAFSKIVLVKLPVYSRLMVTPNPAVESATFSFVSDHNADVSIRLVDLTGNSVRSEQYHAGTGLNTLPLKRLQELPNGIYVLQLYDGENYEKIKMYIRH